MQSKLDFRLPRMYITEKKTDGACAVRMTIFELFLKGSVS